MKGSPYRKLPVKKWRRKTLQLIKNHPLNSQEIVEVVLKVWQDILSSEIGSKPFRIGIDMFPKPQTMGFFIHELIPLEFAYRYPNEWRGEKEARDKDLVYIPDPQYSIEIKTSSSPRHIFGNRSYAQESSKAKKSKSGYYLAINFEKFTGKTKGQPEIRRIRFGWLDHDDWTGQKAPTGQQARLLPEVEKGKLLCLYPAEQ
jgi:hypothetical protein